MRRNPTLAQTKSSVQVILDGRNEDGLSTHLSIWTQSLEDEFVTESLDDGSNLESSDNSE